MRDALACGMISFRTISSCRQYGQLENFTAEDVTVEAGESKKSVVVNDYVTPNNAMEKIYAQVIVE